MMDITELYVILVCFPGTCSFKNYLSKVQRKRPHRGKAENILLACAKGSPCMIENVQITFASANHMNSNTL